jgi:oligo-alginate lyase
MQLSRGTEFRLKCSGIVADDLDEEIIDTLEPGQRSTIEHGILRPLADFISVQSPETFDRIHNHGTWAVAAVGMTGYAIGDDEYVQKALYGLNRDGKSGFIKQLDQLFSPDGYYTEGPYYQRYALMPFICLRALFMRIVLSSGYSTTVTRCC